MYLLTYGVSIPSISPRMLVLYRINVSENQDVFFFLFTDISNDENMLLRIFFDNEIPQEENNIFVRRYLYDCTRLSQSNS